MIVIRTVWVNSVSPMANGWFKFTNRIDRDINKGIVNIKILGNIVIRRMMKALKF